jgi:hypothetical protein
VRLNVLRVSSSGEIQPAHSRLGTNTVSFAAIGRQRIQYLVVPDKRQREESEEILSLSAFHVNP